MAEYDDDGAVIDNDTGEVLAGGELMTVAPSGIVAAEISQQVATARAFPRRSDKVIMNEILGRAILSEAVAKECVYALKRDDKTISGPSIRLAEIIAAAYGNLRVATRFVRIDADDPERCAVIVQAVAHDCETNNSITKDIRRSIMTSAKGGRKARMYNADMTNVTVNAAQSIAQRNAVLAVVPKALWLGAYHRAVAVVKGTQETLGKRRGDLIAEFIDLGATEADIYAALGVDSIVSIKIDHMPVLQGMLNAANEGEPINAVLGRLGVAEPVAHERVENPLRDKPRETSQPRGMPLNTADNGVGEDEDRRVQAREEHVTRRSERSPDLKPASGDTRLPQVDMNTGDNRPRDERGIAKDDQITSGQALQRSAAATEQGSDGPHKDAGENGQSDSGAAGKRPGPLRAPPFDDEASYVAFMRWHFEHTKSPTALKDAWASTRADRRELLSVKVNDEITAEYNAAQAELA